MWLLASLRARPSSRRSTAIAHPSIAIHSPAARQPPLVRPAASMKRVRGRAPGASSPQRGPSRTCRPSGACAGSIPAGPRSGSAVAAAGCVGLEGVPERRLHVGWRKPVPVHLRNGLRPPARAAIKPDTWSGRHSVLAARHGIRPQRFPPQARKKRGTRGDRGTKGEREASERRGTGEWRGPTREREQPGGRGPRGEREPRGEGSPRGRRRPGSDRRPRGERRLLGERR